MDASLRPRRRPAHACGRVGENPQRRRGAANQDRGGGGGSDDPPSLRDRTRRRTKSPTQPPGAEPAPPPPLPAGRRRGVVKTLAKNRRKSLFDGPLSSVTLARPMMRVIFHSDPDGEPPVVLGHARLVVRII